MAAKRKSDASSVPPFKFDDAIPINRVFLALNNPRHEPVETEAEAIERLCATEDVYPLARDIVRHGLSPLERFAMVPIDANAANPTYFVAEGNRRVCALKLLGDPDLAPPKLRKNFERLAEGWTSIRTVPAAVFSDLETLRVWLDRVHSGPQGGIGRRTWDADQKQRFFGGSKNKLAQAVLDYAEAEKMITKEERKGKLTTAQRFLNPDVFQEALGLDRSNPDELSRTRPKAEFDTMLRRFMRDIVLGKDVTSRKNKPEIIQYARTLSTLPGVTNARIEAEALSAGPAGEKKTRVRRTPRKPEKARHVRFEDDLSRALQGLGNGKLESLYFSICSLELERHTPIVCIGVWAFFETLTACQGRDGTDFLAFLSKQRLEKLGFPDSKAIREALGRVHAYGNSTKHHPVAATFNGDQLNNDMIALKDVVLACVAEAAATP